MTVYLVLSRSYQEGMEAARALSLRPAIWPSEPWHVTTQDAEHVVLLRVEGWERSSQTAEVVTLAEQAATCEMTVPTADWLKHGPERAARAAAELATIREVKAHGSVSVDPWAQAGQAATAAAEPMMNRLMHWLHLCPTSKAGLPCVYPPGTCRWPS